MRKRRVKLCKWEGENKGRSRNIGMEAEGGRLRGNLVIVSRKTDYL